MDTTIPSLASIVDIGKEVFHLVGFDADGKIAFRRPGLVAKIEFSIEVLRNDLTLLQQALPPRLEHSPTRTL